MEKRENNNKRNSSIDLLKGILIMGIMMLHCYSNLVPVENLSKIDQYIFSLTSYIVPTFFVISGFYFYKSSNKLNNIKNLVFSYILFVIMGFIISYFLYGTIPLDIIKNIISLNASSFGYLWFVKFLIYFQIFAYIVLGKKNNYKFIFILIWLINIILYVFGYIDPNINYFYNILPYFIGILLASRFENVVIKNKLIWLLIIILPFMINLEYRHADWQLIFGSLLIFIVFKNLLIVKNKINFISNNTIEILFYHYFVIQLLANSYITNIHINIIICFVITLILVFIHDNIKIVLKNLYQNIIGKNQLIVIRD